MFARVRFAMLRPSAGSCAFPLILFGSVPLAPCTALFRLFFGDEKIFPSRSGYRLPSQASVDTEVPKRANRCQSSIVKKNT